MNKMVTWKTRSALALGLVVAPIPAHSIDVFMDWAGSMATMASAWSSAGYAPGAALTGMEMGGIISSVMGKMSAKYASYTVTFSDMAPSAPYEWIKLGATTASTTTYGVSSGIDWRNDVKDGTADIYLANFGPILSSTMFTRAENISRFASAIANTTAHELGHNLGLQHYDAYGIDTVTAPGYFFSGEQNSSIMATGVTGLTAPMRGHDRFFNPMELVKLEYAHGLAPSLGATIMEAPGAKDTLATAQLVYGSLLPISGKLAVNVDAATSIPGQIDIYKFYAESGSLISANTFSHGHMASFTDTTMTLMNSLGVPILMSTDIKFFLDDFMTPTSTYYSDDSLIFNYAATYTGEYYLKISGMGPGEYDLLITGLNPVPEPASMVALSLGVLALIRRSRRI